MIGLGNIDFDENECNISFYPDASEGDMETSMEINSLLTKADWNFCTLEVA